MSIATTSGVRAKRPLRLPGLLVVVGIVLLGLLSGAAYLHYKAPRLKAELDARMASAPKTAAGRLERWHEYGAPNIHHRLTTFARFSPEQPWLVTHGVALADGVYELHGVDLSTTSAGELTVVEELTVVIRLPAPGPLGRAALTPEQLGFVPVVAPGEAPPDARRRLEEIATYLLERMPQALERDIPGASLEIRVAGEEGG